MASSVLDEAPALERKEVAVVTALHGTPVAVDHCALWERAFARCGVSRNEAAGLLGMSPFSFSKAFSRNYPDQNVTMKRLSPGAAERTQEQERRLAEVTLWYASLLAAEVGLGVGLESEEVVRARRFIEAFSTMVRAAK